MVDGHCKLVSEWRRRICNARIKTSAFKLSFRIQSSNMSSAAVGDGEKEKEIEIDSMNWMLGDLI